jgi:hypothetical protein
VRDLCLTHDYKCNGRATLIAALNTLDGGGLDHPNFSNSCI